MNNLNQMKPNKGKISQKQKLQKNKFTSVNEVKLSNNNPVKCLSLAIPL